MKRIVFLKKLLGAAGALLLPIKHLQARQKHWLLRFHVRGFQYYEGQDLLEQLDKNDRLELIREPDNKYDEHAIALHYRGRKIGFVPREKNEVISALLDAGTPGLQATILSVEKELGPWEAVYAGIFIEKNTGLAA